MKSIYLRCTRLFVYWIEIPLIILLTLCIHFNDEVKSAVKLYPLIIICILAMIFVIVYFFRFIEISFAEIRYIGRFTSRDSAVINEGKTLILTLLELGKVGIQLRGYDGPSEINWASEDEDPRNLEIRLFRGLAYGGKATVKKILSYFGVDKGSFDAIFDDKNYCADFEFVTVSTTVNAEEHTEIHIRMNETTDGYSLQDDKTSE